MSICTSLSCVVNTQRVTFSYCSHLVVTLIFKYLDPPKDDMQKAVDVVFSGDKVIPKQPQVILRYLVE